MLGSHPKYVRFARLKFQAPDTKSGIGCPQQTKNQFLLFFFFFGLKSPEFSSPTLLACMHDRKVGLNNSDYSMKSQASKLQNIEK
ncbi:hypothetical protein ES332_A10G070000v1 [Gossypium tomentosum]|uniref:Uncharacterized protein n=1 Tax=Gossypium tomentosum TaxID=34277 RepID=A0A5D2NP83_GOSTO|nr:hypothetical protein ES332_A10G070000v1 [Gossypium tomentosum]